jgi:putative phosphoesterase
MRIGVISDVHSNYPALETVLSFLKSKGVDRIVHAGDVVGYNAFPREVISCFMKEGLLSISGNHDRVVAGSTDPVYAGKSDIARFNSDAACAVLWTQRIVGREELNYISGLKPRERFTAEGRTIAVIHGSPFDDDRYVYEEEVTQGCIEAAGADILILGHTHFPYIKKFEPGIVLNPGSVGQPRDGDPRASCAIIETESVEASVHRLEYPVEETVNANINAGLPAFLAERLKRGF